MKSKPTWFIAAISLILLGVVSFAMQPVLDPEPDTVCVGEGEPSSGFVDQNKDCNVSIESFEQVADWQSKPKPFRILGLVLIIAGVAVGVVAVVRGRRGNEPPGPA